MFYKENKENKNIICYMTMLTSKKSFLLSLSDDVLYWVGSFLSGGWENKNSFCDEEDLPLRRPRYARWEEEGNSVCHEYNENGVRLRPRPARWEEEEKNSSYAGKDLVHFGLVNKRFFFDICSRQQFHYFKSPQCRIFHPSRCYREVLHDEVWKIFPFFCGQRQEEENNNHEDNSTTTTTSTTVTDRDDDDAKNATTTMIEYRKIHRLDEFEENVTGFEKGGRVVSHEGCLFLTKSKKNKRGNQFPLVLKQDGLWKQRYENGQLMSEGTYQNDLKEGLWKYWDENGQLISEGTYQKGAREGLWKYWHKNGQLWSEELLGCGIGEGLMREWYPNGQLEKEGSYKNGSEEGLWREWYPDGQLEKEGSYKNGKQKGLWKLWHHDDDQLEKSKNMMNNIPKDNLKRQKTWMNVYENKKESYSDYYLC